MGLLLRLLTLSLLIPSCGRLDITKPDLAENTPMTESGTVTNHASASWISFLHVLQKIGNIESQKQIESAQEWLNPWRGSGVDRGHAKDAENVDEIARTNQLVILKNELQRKRSRLRKRPGRQERTDWIASLKSNTERLQAETELSVLPVVSMPDLREVQAYLKQSRAFSAQLLDADIDQVKKRVSEGEYSSTPELEQLLEQATALRDRTD